MCDRRPPPVAFRLGAADTDAAASGEVAIAILGGPRGSVTAAGFAVVVTVAVISELLIPVP
jgi:hypothetical protein